MIILDTNVVSDLMRGDAGDPRVRSWIRALPEQPATTVITRAEVLSGIAILPDGERKSLLLTGTERILSELAVSLPLTDDCAPAYAAIVAERRALGLPMGKMDALIAAIARTTGAGIATRDLSDFDGLGIRLVDPWHTGA